jgi:hypothetical protein
MMLIVDMGENPMVPSLESTGNVAFVNPLPQFIKFICSQGGAVFAGKVSKLSASGLSRFRLAFVQEVNLITTICVRYWHGSEKVRWDVH